MNLELYKVLHVTGLVLVTLGIGGMLTTSGEKLPKSAMLLHGVGMLVLVVAGFGMMAKTGTSSPDTWSAWLILKMVAWFFVAALPTLLKRGMMPRAAGWIVATALAGAATWLGIVKPF